MPDTLIRQYRLTELLGTGRHGETWLAIDEALQRPVTLKFLPASLVTDSAWRERYLDARTRLNRLTHAQITVFFALDTETDRPFLVREYAPGRSIAQDSDGQPLFYSDFLYIAAQAAAALTSAQSEEITLGNITPANIIVDDVRHIRLVDCCLPWPSPGKTVDSYELSDMRYRAPEQLEGGEVTPASDIFALGLVFYELLTGVYPIEADTVESYRERLTTEPLDFNSIASQRIPTDAHLLLESMCAIDPAER
ncbi:protein kinase, partial [candidate division GN15 bacterium]|nr:protein kinase [candidate division GN15 bacterium]